MSKELCISNILKDLGVAASLSGYRYLKYAIELAAGDWSYVENICHKLYPEIAKHFDSTVVRVERAIRHAIESGWMKGNLETVDKLFGYTISDHKGKPTNSEFISTVADYYIMIRED